MPGSRTRGLPRATEQRPFFRPPHAARRKRPQAVRWSFLGKQPSVAIAITTAKSACVPRGHVWCLFYKPALQPFTRCGRGKGCVSEVQNTHSFEKPKKSRIKTVRDTSFWLPTAASHLRSAVLCPHPTPPGGPPLLHCPAHLDPAPDRERRCLLESSFPGELVPALSPPPEPEWAAERPPPRPPPLCLGTAVKDAAES